MIMHAFLVIAVISTILLIITLIVGDFLEGVLDGVEVGGSSITGPALFAGIAIMGFVASGSHSMGLRPIPATLLGVGAGLLAGWAAGVLTAKLSNAGTKHVETTELIGREAVVITPTKEGAWGQVKLEVEGIPRTFSAKSEDNISQGEQVVIKNILSSTSVVVERKGE